MLTTILLFIALLAVLVLVHEFGHFIVAKKSGVAVEEFGVGFPPRLAAVKFRGTLYTINLLPLGGFVRIKGVADDEKDPSRLGDADSFATKSFGVRLLILFAGVGMNMVFAFLLLTVGFKVGLPTVVDNIPASATVSEKTIRIASVLENSPLENQVRVGDVLVSLNGITFSSIPEVQEFNASRAGQKVDVTLRRGEETLTTSVSLMTLESGKGALGVGLLETAIVSYPWLQSIGEGFKATFSVIGQIFAALGSIIAGLFTGAGVPEGLSGPVGIAVLTGEVARLGVIYILQFAALLSLNLAIFNLLPIPALDGGRILFVLIERFRGKSLAHTLESKLHHAGFFFLLALIVLVTVRDIQTYADRMTDFFKQLFT